MLSGEDVLAALEADPLLAERHAVVLMTAASRNLPPAVAKAMDRLGVAVVAKPFDIDDVVAAVELAALRLGTSVANDDLVSAASPVRAQGVTGMGGSCIAAERLVEGAGRAHEAERSSEKGGAKAEARGSLG